MVSKTTSSDVSAPNSVREPISDDDLIRGFILALGAGGRKSRTLFIYEDSIRNLSDFARTLGLSRLAAMDRVVIQHWLSSLHQQGNKPATVSIRYRSLARFFRWCVKLGASGDRRLLFRRYSTSPSGSAAPWVASRRLRTWARPVAFFASADAINITGQSLNVNGGKRMD